MKAASFFILSATLHAAALAYPVSFAARNPVTIIPVILIPEVREPASAGAAGQGSSPKQARFDSGRTTHRGAEKKPGGEPERIAPPPPAPIERSEPAETFSAGGMEQRPAGAAAAPAGEGLSEDPDGRGNVFGASGGRNGEGGGTAASGNGNGTGAPAAGEVAHGGAILTQARYRETPRPDYPESARREGREGRVLLRVLVDERGRSKEVEINSSSGSAALDRAAAEAIRRWRFEPARDGDRPIESWLRIPIVFRLEDARN